MEASAVQQFQQNLVNNAKAMVTILKSFFSRNNPVRTVVASTHQMIYQARTFKSHLKILKFRFMLYKMQLNSMEQQLNTASPYQHLGHKLNKSY